MHGGELVWGSELVQSRQGCRGARICFPACSPPKQAVDGHNVSLPGLLCRTSGPKSVTRWFHHGNYRGQEPAASKYELILVF